MSWTAVFALCAAAYALKAAGAVVATSAPGGERTGDRLEVLVVPVLAGLVVVQTFGAGAGMTLDGRAAALLVAGVLIWRRAPLVVIVAAAGATAALLYAAGV